MSYRALLFCADEKTSRAVTQVFRELEFHVEPSREPFDAVKRITGQHYDALVVDCDNEENATLLFKSARNSASNNNSLAVALVEGQVNIAKAFRLGANLVLTKPINLEQAKGTLRVARGLLRKAETNKLNPSAPLEPVVEAQTRSEAVHSPAPQKSVLTPVPVEAPTASASIAAKVESKQRRHLCCLTSGLTGTQRHCAARRMLPRTARGAMPLRVRVERPVRRQAQSSE